MKTISALVLCTAKRLKYLEDCINSLEPNYFDQKILSIDEFGNHKFPNELKEKYENLGWELVIDNHQSKLGSLINSLDKVTSDFVFYQEDDIIVNLPDKNFILNQLDTTYTNRQCGWISLNLGGAQTDLKNRVYADLIRCEDNKILSTEEYFSFLREEEVKNDWFFEFPSIFIDKNIFQKNLSIMKNLGLYDNYSVEQNLTKIWFQSNMDKQYYKCCVAKNNLKEVLLNTPDSVMQFSSFIITLDPNQVAS